MIFIGDTHRDFDRYREVLILAGNESTFQVGDFGLMKPEDAFEIEARHRFCRGNHDNPAVCRAHPNYLGDYAYNSKLKMFWMSGGYSIDNAVRTIGIDWWDDEELRYGEMMQAIELYKESKPRIMVSHEAPTIIKNDALRANPASHAYGKEKVTSRTESALQAMFDAHRPDVWIYGHYHYPVDIGIGGTRFVGLGDHRRPITEQMFELPGLSW